MSQRRERKKTVLKEWEVLSIVISYIVRLSRRMRWVGHAACMGEMRGVYRALVGKPEDKQLLGKPRSRWEDNINTIA
jgi:hypothetical protein